MIGNARKILFDAYHHNYAIGHFNVYNLESALSVIRAAEEKKAPVFLATTGNALEYAGFKNLTTIIRSVAEESSAPIIIHLDHSKNFETAEKCVHAGYNSVMFDGSKLDLDKNIEITRKISDLAHHFGVICEAEIGIVGNVSEHEKILNLTNPDDAVLFVKETAVDSLAVAIGNKHGLPIGKEQIDFNRLKTIKQKTTIPLVYHGASSTSPYVIKKLIKLGINKFNIDQDLRYSFTHGLEQYLKNHPDEIDPRKALKFAAIKTQKVIESKIAVFGSANKM